MNHVSASKLHVQELAVHTLLSSPCDCSGVHGPSAQASTGTRCVQAWCRVVGAVHRSAYDSPRIATARRAAGVRPGRGQHPADAGRGRGRARDAGAGQAAVRQPRLWRPAVRPAGQRRRGRQGAPPAAAAPVPWWGGCWPAARCSEAAGRRRCGALHACCVGLARRSRAIGQRLARQGCARHFDLHVLWVSCEHRTALRAGRE